MLWLSLATLFCLMVIGKSATHRKAAYEPSCRDQHGNKVDWFIILKLPMFEGNEMSSCTIYFTSEMGDFEESCGSQNPAFDIMINTLGNILTHTGNDWKHRDNYNITSFFYESCGHSARKILSPEGAMFVNDEEGFWIFSKIHYRNNIVPSIGDYIYSHVFGELIVCISFQLKEVETIAKQLQHMHAVPVSPTRRTSDIKSRTIRDMVDHMDFSNSTNTFNHVNFYSNKVKFYSFAIKPYKSEDIYGDVAETLNTDMLVRWKEQHTGKKFVHPRVTDIEHIYKRNKFTFQASFVPSIAFTDESEWAISVSKDQKEFWFCFGDKGRHVDNHCGGQVICFESKVVWSTFNKLLNNHTEHH